MATKKSSPMPTMQGQQDWQVHEDTHTLKRAHEIMSDPKRHAAAKTHAKKVAQEYDKVAAGPAKAPAKRGAR